MDRTTDGAATEALRAPGSRAAAERLARRALHRAERRRRIVTAASIDVDDRAEHARRILDWLVDWDESTIHCVVELVAATCAVAEGGQRQVDLDGQPIIQWYPDATAPDRRPSGGRP